LKSAAPATLQKQTWDSKSAEKAGGSHRLILSTEEKEKDSGGARCRSLFAHVSPDRCCCWVGGCEEIKTPDAPCFVCILISDKPKGRDTTTRYEEVPRSKDLDYI